ncbi:MAG: VIT and vWA domain-containing protein [Planctomycetota bacterium]
MRKHTFAVIAGLAILSLVSVARAAGTLTPVGAPQQPIQIRDHHVNVVILNGFATTEVTQVFFNPNAVDLEAIYSCPLPASASLSEVTITIGELEIAGEVLARKEAQQIYEEERDKGNDAGLATKNGYQNFEFRVTPVRAQSETRVRYLYYQPLEIDTGVGRYLYPLEEGGTDDVGASFWQTNAKVEGTFSASLELKSAWPVTELRVPGFETAAKIDRLDEGHYRVALATTGVSLDRDLIVYYRLADDLPGRIEVIPYRAAEDQPGTFMMVVTPGIDLKPLAAGADYVFVLDVSGSMQTKIQTLARGVVKVLKQMNPADRFRVVTFNDSARELTSGWQAATERGVVDVATKIESLAAGGSTNLFAGITLGFQKLDADRATSIVLVTDGVTNTGVVDPLAFHKLMQQFDVRVFGFLLGNSANWPLLRTICDASGGFYAAVSNDDDIIGQILLAKSKITHECLHDARLEIRGVKVYDHTKEILGKVYRGQQVVMFGRYEAGGEARVTLKARLTGEDRTYQTTFRFPDVETENPEIERLWALAQIETIELAENAGVTPANEARDAIANLGTQYQLVTDHTSMLVLSDNAFQERGIERRNQARVAVEEVARTQRQTAPPVKRRVDEAAPAFPSRASGLGGGAIDPITGVVVLVVGAVGAVGAIRRRRKGSES